MLPKKKSRPGKWIAFVIIVLLLAGTVTFFLLKRDSEVYERVKAESSDITTYHSFTGNIEVRHRQTIIADMVMQITDLRVKDGDKVKKGDILAETSIGSKLTADIDGEVSGISVEENAMVMAGAKLMEVVDYSDLKISVKVDEYDIGSLKEGKEAAVKIGALNKEIKGKIGSISKEGVVANGVTYFTAVIDLGEDTALKAGMSAEVRLADNTVKEVVTIPMSVVRFDDNNTPYVLKEDPSGRPVRTDIETGINNGTIVEVKKGVANGETVLYTNPDKIPGMRLGGQRTNGAAGGGSDNG